MDGTFMLVRLLIALFGSLASGVACAQVLAPTLLRVMHYGAPVTLVAHSARRQLLAVHFQSKDSNEARITYLDVRDRARPAILAAQDLPVAARIALSQDGNQLVTVSEAQRPMGITPGRYTVRRFDITDLKHPRALDSRMVEASLITIAGDGSAYATISPPEPAGGAAQLEVTWTADGRKRTALGEWNNLPGRFRFSSDGRFLISSSYSSTRVFDLHAPDGALPEVKSNLSANCVLGATASGNLVLVTGRDEHVALHALRPGLPELGALPQWPTGVGLPCYTQTFARPGEVIVIFDAPYLAKLDLAATPTIAGQWGLRTGMYPLFITDDTAYVMDGKHPGDLYFYALDVTQPFLADGPALRRAHAEAMQAFQRDQAKGTRWHWDAIQILEKAGVQRLLSGSVTGISDRERAAILNDYGFFRSESGQKSAETVYRRVLEIDPRRRVANLNLAQLMLSGIGERSDWQEKTARRAEIATSYQRYRELGGKPVQDIEAFLAIPWNELPAKFCSTIASLATQGQLGYFLSESGRNISVGTRKLDVEFSTQGTAHVPTWSARLAGTDEAVEALPMPSGLNDAWGGDNLGLLSYGGSHHTLFYKDDRHPGASISLAGDQSCEFKVTTDIRLSEHAVEPQLCRALMTESKPHSLPFTGRTWLTHGDVRKRFGETGITGTRRVDFRNDGKPVTLAAMQLSSGAGAGCDAGFFDVLDANAARFEDGPTRDLLFTLQNADPTGRYPIGCGNEARFFEYAGKTYFENKPKVWPPEDRAAQYHRVARVRDGHVEDVCGFRFATKVEAR